MANILSLAMKINADASGVVKNLTPAERALENLGKAAGKTTSAFDKFAKDSAAAASAQASLNQRFDDLAKQLQGGLNAQEYASQFAALQEEVRQTADAFEEGARLTRELRTEQEIHAERVARLNELVRAGAIDEQTYARGVAQADAALAKASRSADSFAKQTERARSAGLGFNEISGIFSSLPGPLGNIAGRLSGLSSAGSGLARVFSGGLSSGIASVTGGLAALATPVGVAAAAIAALTAGASAVVNGLQALEKEVEKLQNAADKLGVSFAFIQTLEQAAEMTGVSFDTVNSSMTRLLKTLAGADEESKTATAALERLGVSLDDLNGLDSEGQLRLIGERLSQIEDPAKRAAAATAIFGKSGAELLPFFNGLAEAEVTLNRFNARLSEIDAQRVQSLGDSFDAVNASMDGLNNELLTPFIGITQSISDGLASLVASWSRNWGAILDVLSPVTSLLGLVTNAILQLGAVGNNLLGTFLEPFAAYGRAISAAYDFVSRVITQVAGSINDAIIRFREFFKFGDLTKAFTDSFARVSEVFESVSSVVQRVVAIINAAFQKLAEYLYATIGETVLRIGQLVNAFLEFTGISDRIELFAQIISQAFGDAWELIKGVAGTIGGIIEDVLVFAEEWLGIKRQVEEPVEATVEVAAGNSISQLQQQTGEAARSAELLAQALSSAIDESAQFGQEGLQAALKYQQALQEIADLALEGEYNLEQVRRAQELARQEYDEDIAALEEERRAHEESAAAAQKAADDKVAAAQRAATADRERVDAFIEGQKTQQEKEQENAQKTLEAIRREQARTEQAIADARAAGDAAAVEREQQRLAVLEQQEAIAADIASGDRARREEQEKADKERADAEMKRVEEVAAEEKKKQQELANERLRVQQQVDQLLSANMSPVDRERAKAAENVLLIEQDIAATRQAVAAAEAQGDLAAVAAGEERLRQLDQAQQREQDIASGRADEEKRIAGIRQQLAENYQRQQQAALQEYQQQQKKAQEEYAREQQRIAEEQRKIAEAEAKRQEERLQKLNTLGEGTVNAQDIRSTEGASLVLQLAANAQDPRLIQERLQTKLLEVIANGITQAAGNYFNTPVAIVGYAQLTGE